jgi:hypothetical protein
VVLAVGLKFGDLLRRVEIIIRDDKPSKNPSQWDCRVGGRAKFGSIGKAQKENDKPGWADCWNPFSPDRAEGNPTGAEIVRTIRGIRNLFLRCGQSTGFEVELRDLCRRLAITFGNLMMHTRLFTGPGRLPEPSGGFVKRLIMWLDEITYELFEPN